MQWEITLAWQLIFMEVHICQKNYMYIISSSIEKILHIFHLFSFLFFLSTKNLHHQYNRTKITFSTDFSWKHWSNKSFISAKKVPLHALFPHPSKNSSYFQSFFIPYLFCLQKTFNLRTTKQNYIFHRILFSEHWSNKSFHYPFRSLSSKIVQKVQIVQIRSLCSNCSKGSKGSRGANYFSLFIFIFIFIFHPCESVFTFIKLGLKIMYLRITSKIYSFVIHSIYQRHLLRDLLRYFWWYY